ncbi:MAG: hypothetical protein ACYSWO_02070 [Planctomycetota bacterium]
MELDGARSTFGTMCGIICVAVSAILTLGLTATADGRDLDNLRVLSDGYPRVFFFRQVEGMPARMGVTYEQWENTFDRLMGIEGKALDEEIPGRSLKNIEFFTRFKQRHPDQLVLLHFNGNARDPRWESDKFFAGHWIYFNGAKILSDIPAEQGETDIRVDKPNLFKVNMGRYRSRNEDIGLCVLDADGKPDWHKSEQVQLISVDVKAKTIRVRRGCFGTKPRAFKAGSSYAAAHATEGPWGSRNNLLWYYNYSTRCPRDKQGRTCSDVLVDHLDELFGPDGALAAFDGLEFDVLKWRCGGGRGARGLDCDADGKPDAGLHGGFNAYGAGVVEFCRRLRAKLGDETLILADGMHEGSQRAFGILNGIESEGWPHLRDHEIKDWSGGLNRHFFWNANSSSPVANYINHKFNVPTGKPGIVKHPNIPFSRHRLVFAVGIFTDSAMCYSFAPPTQRGAPLGIWDEFRMGTENKLGWLGKPLGPAVRMATRKPDLLKGRINPTGDGVRFERGSAGLKVTATSPKAREIRFSLTGVPCEGPDLFVSLTGRGGAMKGYPMEVARMMYVAAGSQRFMTWVNDKDFDSTFYFSKITSNSIDLEFVIEGSESLWISNVRAHAHPDAIYREFENGLVLANPSPRPYVFELSKLVPGKSFRRLRGSSRQDTIANNGSMVADKLELGPKEGLFLVRVE